MSLAMDSSRSDRYSNDDSDSGSVRVFCEWCDRGFILQCFVDVGEN